MAISVDRLRVMHANMHPWVRAGLWLGLMAAIALFAGRPAYRAFKGWRAQDQLEKARQALAQGNPSEARECAYAAIALAPQDFEIIPVLARSLRALKDPRATDLARYLLGHPDGSEADKLLGFQILADDGPLATLGAAWAYLGPERQQQTVYRAAFIRRLIEQTQYGEAWGLLQEGAERGKNPALDVLWIEMAMVSQEGKLWYDAQVLGRKILADHSDFGPQVLASWEKLPENGVQDESAKAAEAWCAAQGDKAPVAARLAAEWLAGAVLPKDQQDARLQQTISRFLPVNPAELGNWLTRHGHADRVLQLTVPAELVDTLPWFEAKAKALEAVKDWQGLLEHLEKAPSSASPLELTCQKMRAAAEIGDTARRNLEWEQARALALADSNRNAWLILADAAMVANMKEQAEDAMVAAMKLGRGRLPLQSRLQTLIQSLGKRGRGRDLLDVFARLAALEPGNLMVQVNYAYWGLIHGKADPNFVVEQMEAARKVLPDALPVRVTLGLAWLVKKDPVRAGEAMTMPSYDWKEAGTSYRAVYGTVLMLNGKTAEAENVLTGLVWDSMLPRETNFFQDLLKPFQEEGNAVPWLSTLKRRPEVDGAAVSTSS